MTAKVRRLLRARLGVGMGALSGGRQMTLAKITLCVVGPSRRAARFAHGRSGEMSALMSVLMAKRPRRLPSSVRGPPPPGAPINDVEMADVAGAALSSRRRD